MANKKLIPVILIGTGLAAAAFTLFGKSSGTPDPNQYNPQQGSTPPNPSPSSGGSWLDWIQKVIQAGAGAAQQAGELLKASGSFSGTQLVAVAGKNLTGILSLSTVKRLKAGNKITIASNSFSGSYEVVQMGNAYGGLTSTLIVINKPYVFASTLPAGTYKEV